MYEGVNSVYAAQNINMNIVVIDNVSQGQVEIPLLVPLLLLSLSLCLKKMG